MSREMMVGNTCEAGHEVVLFISAVCPLCEAAKEADRRVAVLEEKLALAQQRIEDYRSELGL